MKLAIRTDREAGYVRAYCASIDGKDMTELGAIRLTVLDGRDGPFFRRWLDLMREAMAIAIKGATGAEVTGWSGDIDPADLESEPQG